MNIFQRVNQAYNVLTQKNSMGNDISNKFLKYGNSNRRPLLNDWSNVVLTEKEFYTGYPYAAINLRANRVSTIAENNLKTSANQNIIDQAKENKEVITHPYLDIIHNSTDFSDYQFWYDIPTYIDLKGVYYLMAVRNFTANRLGEIQYFKLLNPFHIKRIVKEENMEVGGYVEYRDGYSREIPKEMIIEIRKLNPNSWRDEFSLLDAASENQYALKTAGDFTRNSLKNNINAPGILSTDVVLPDEEFINFTNRVKGGVKGEPVFGNGAGSIKWQDMQIDLDKAALDKVNEINREALIAVTGASKTILAIEQSGVTRDTAKVQKDLFTENHAIPMLQMIIDALNIDYQKNYKADYEKFGYEIYIDNPLGSDRDAELKDVDIRDKSYDLYNKLVNKGYDRELAAQYAEGEKTLEELGEPTNEPVSILPAQTTTDTTTQESHTHEPPVIVSNQFDEEQQGIVNQQQSTLENAVINIDARLVASAISKVSKNQYESETDVVNKSDKKDAEEELATALEAFYTLLIPLYARNVLSRRAAEFGDLALFNMNAEVKKYIKKTASEAAQGHIQTILDDILKTARDLSLEGASQEQVATGIRNKYNKTISTTRAKTIARTETNRAFTRSQFEADKQFIKQNNLQGRAYKKWITRSDNPCPLCQAKASEPPIPFDQAFADIGDQVSATYEENGKTKVLKQVIGFETVEAGTLHPNCSCTYQLLIE